MKAFIIANPILATIIAIVILAILYRIIKKARSGETESPDNLVPDDSTDGSQRIQAVTNIGASLFNTSGYTNAPKASDMGGAAARTSPMGAH